jgi:ubiquinone/menaquinone biosynthesis C-methylase UbiE
VTEDSSRGVDPAILTFYDRAPEESRLETDRSQLEKLRTQELILRHAPESPAVVLDVGGAAGVYAFWLAERGYEVHLLDATPRLVDVARRRNEAASSPLASCRVADARALPVADNSASMMLLLGPLYHLPDVNDRRVALSEARRVLRPAGVLFAAGISRFASALDGLSRELFRDPAFASIVERDLIDGHHLNPTGRLDYFTTAFFHHPDELRQEVTDSGFDVLNVYGIEGPGWLLSDFDELWNDPARREILLRVARALELEPSVLGCSAHVLAVGRKPAR